MTTKGRRPARESREPAAAPAPVHIPSPEETELAGLGMIVGIMRHMTTAERWKVVDYLALRYGYRLDDEPISVPAPYLPGDVNDLARELIAAQHRSIELGSHALAKIILDAGWRKLGETE